MILDQYKSSTVFRWSMREGSINDQVNSYNLTQVGSPIWVSNTKGRSLKFGGTGSDRFTSTARPTASGTYITMFEHRNTGAVSGRLLVGSQSATARCYFGIYGATGAENLAGGIGTQGYTTIKGTSVLQSEAVYVGVLTWNGTTVSLYLNGNREYSAAQSGSAETGRDIYFGLENNNGVALTGNAWNSTAYECVLLNRALTSAEVAQVSEELLSAPFVTLQEKRHFSGTGQTCVYKNTFVDAFVSLSATSQNLNGWDIVSGTWKISEDASGKHLLCVTNGTVKTPLTGASGFITETFEEVGSATLTKNANDLQIDALAGDKIYKIILTI